MFLLDTNIVLPLIDPDLPRHSRDISALLGERAPDCVCSAATLWELAIKSRLGKLTLPCDDLELIESCAAINLPVLAVTPVHAVTPVTPWPDTNDPFDRILLSICQVEGLQLVTTDAKLRHHPLAWRP